VVQGLARIDVGMLRENLRMIIASIDRKLSAREEIRDNLIKAGRDVIRLSGWAINAIHRMDINTARSYIEEMEKIIKEFIKLAQRDSYLWHSGFVNNVLSEYAEAVILFNLVVEGKLVGYEELGISEIPYLQGLGDVLGELRRLALDLMRVGDIESAEKILDIMEVMYYEIRVLEYPDALMPGVRHKVDVARRLIDDTKALLLTVKARLGA